MSKLTVAQYSTLAPLWDVAEQESVAFNAAALFALFPDCWVSKIGSATVAALLGRIQAHDGEQVWWVHQWIVDKTRSQLLQGRHTARTMREGVDFVLPLGITVAYGASPDARAHARGIAWSESLIATGAVWEAPTVSGKLYRVDLVAYRAQMILRS